MKIKVKHHPCTWDCFTLHLFHFERSSGNDRVSVLLARGTSGRNRPSSSERLFPVSFEDQGVPLPVLCGTQKGCLRACFLSGHAHTYSFQELSAASGWLGPLQRLLAPHLPFPHVSSCQQPQACFPPLHLCVSWAVSSLEQGTCHIRAAAGVAWFLSARRPSEAL